MNIFRLFVVLLALFVFKASVYAKPFGGAKSDIRILVEDDYLKKCGAPCAVGGGVIGAAGYLGNSAVTGDFTWAGLGTAAGVGALTGATLGLGGPLGAVWGFNAALGGSLATAVADKLNHHDK